MAALERSIGIISLVIGALAALVAAASPIEALAAIVITGAGLAEWWNLSEQAPETRTIANRLLALVGAALLAIAMF